MKVEVEVEGLTIKSASRAAEIIQYPVGKNDRMGGWTYHLIGVPA